MTEKVEKDCGSRLMVSFNTSVQQVVEVFSIQQLKLLVPAQYDEVG